MTDLLNIIVLAAGKGSRMQSPKPKVLHEVGNREMILHVLDLCYKLKPKNIYVVLGANSNLIKNTLPKDVKIIKQKKQLGTAHALLCAKEKIEKSNGKLLVLYGDVPLIGIKTLKTLTKKNNKNISMLGFETKSPKGYGRIKIYKNKIIQVIEDKNLSHEDKIINLCYSGIFIGITKTIFSLLKKIKKDRTSHEYLLTDMFEISYNENISVRLVLASEDEVMGINNLHQLSLAEEYFQNKIREKFLANGVVMKDPKSVYFSFDTKIGQNVKIDPNNYFGKNVVIRDNVILEANNKVEDTIINDQAIIGPFCRLRNNTVIGKKVKVGNFVEIKNSRIGIGTKINHLAYIGDCSTGYNCNIGAGTITCNYDGKNKNKTLIGNNVFIGSNCALIAPIKIDSKSFIAAGSTISDNLGVQDFSIARAKQKIIKKGSKKFLK